MMAQAQQMMFSESSLFVRKQTQECPVLLTKADGVRLCEVQWFVWF
jgi:hypothetical protein